MTRTAAVRLLAIADLDAALALSSASGWNQRLDDWRMLLDLAPAGSFAAVYGDGIVGTAVGIDYGSFGWVAMMLVDPQWRGQGLGARLLEAAMGALPHDRAIRLDATPLGRPLYRRYGFDDETRLTRYVARTSSHCDGSAEQPLRAMRALGAEHLTSVAAGDELVFGAGRRVLLEWMRGGGPEYAHVIERAAGPEYCFGRRGRLFDQIGPVVAASDETARALMGRSLSAAGGRPVVVDAVDREEDFTVWLQGRGFSAERPLFRMCRQGDQQWLPVGDSDRRLREFAILGPEFG
jgi:GNAT superfamily N-acetyltransferase